MDQQIINLYDEYTHKPLSRQDFFRRLTKIVGSTVAATALLPILENNYASAAVTSDDELFTEYVTFPGVPNEMKAYVARPKKNKKYPVIIVIHENRGLNPHTEDVARRFAKEGYLAIAPNALAALGKESANEDEARKNFQELKAEDNLKNFQNVFDYIKTRKDAKDKVGCVGYCWGGGMVNKLAVTIPDLKAGVAFYGAQPKPEEVPSIKAAILLHYGGLDERINAGIPAYEEALKKNNITYELYIYEGANHAFFNDTSAARYNADAAKLAWERTLKFFDKYLD